MFARALSGSPLLKWLGGGRGFEKGWLGGADRVGGGDLVGEREVGGGERAREVEGEVSW